MGWKNGSGVMGHLHRQALLQRAKERDVLLAAGEDPRLAKARVAACSLAELGDPQTRLEPVAMPPASGKKVARKRGTKRGKKTKA